MLSDDCLNRLINWKFEQAAKKLTDDAASQERDLVESLAAMYGNPGWFGGHMETVIHASLLSVYPPLMCRRCQAPVDEDGNCTAVPEHRGTETWDRRGPGQQPTAGEGEDG